jgi:hypothetical protein
MTEPRDKEHWAAHVEHLAAEGLPEGARSDTVAGRRLMSPLQGFGQMWQKTYRIPVPGHTPEEVIATWKAEYGRFWPTYNKFYAPIAGIKPGEIGLIKGASGPVRLSTGVMVLYADDVSFTYMTPQGHPFAGWITFSADEEDGVTHAQAHALIRANDPLYELGFMFGGSLQEDRMWQHTLRSLAEYLGAPGEVTTTKIKVDRKRQWGQFGNIRHNSAIRTMFRRSKSGG